MDASRFLDRLRTADWYHRQLVHVESIPPRNATYGTLQQPIHPKLQRLLDDRGLWPLYSHQTEAKNALDGNANVIVATPAASGKSLCYHIAALESILSDRSARALYIYPTKALAQDQLRGLKELGESLPVRASIFDGDTPTAERPSIKRSAQIVLTNPDMLHMGILPNHRTWSRLFQGLRFVVLDEAHIYRGIFGSHTANVLRRLRRICRIYGSSPQFALCSATIANPGELAGGLTGLPSTVIDGDGAPSGGKQFAFWNPPVLDKAGTRRRSSNMEAASLLSELVCQDIRTIAFVRTRRVAELVYLYARRQMQSKGPDLVERISPYRASYLPEDRRRIESALFSGELLGVAATNTLELGIDVGSLDATVITGYPGSISSAWQQAGRSGRGQEESLSVLVGQDNPLDQYLMHHPDAFFGKPIEQALISPANPYVIQPHLLCAGYESPLSHADEDIFGSDFSEHIDSLEQAGLLQRSRPVKYPCSQSSLLWDFEDLRSSGLWRPWRPSASNRVELEQDLTHYRYHCNVPRLPTLT